MGGRGKYDDDGSIKNTESNVTTDFSMTTQIRRPCQYLQSSLPVIHDDDKPGTCSLGSDLDSQSKVRKEDRPFLSLPVSPTTQLTVINPQQPRINPKTNLEGSYTSKYDDQQLPGTEKRETPLINRPLSTHPSHVIFSFPPSTIFIRYYFLIENPYVCNKLRVPMYNETLTLLYT